MKHQKSAIIAITFIIALVVTGSILVSHAEQPSVSIKTFAIKHIPFNDYEATSNISGIPIIFSEYGKTVKVSYPAPKEAVIQDPSVITKNCREILSKNVDKILQVETQNSVVKNYLTFEGKIPLLSKESFLGIVASPREKTFQRNAATGKTVAEFRSKEFDIDEYTKFCIYVTFLCDPEKAFVEEIIISAVKLEV